MLFYIAIGLFFGLGVAALIIFGIDLIDNRIRMVSDFEKFFSIPVLGAFQSRDKYTSVREFNSNPEALNDNNYRKELGEARVNFSQRLGDGKLVGLVSPGSKEGKTLTSFLLAQEVAQTGKRVLIVDLDVYSPMMSNDMQVKGKSGLQDYLFGEMSLDEVTYSTKFANLDIVGVGQNFYNTEIYYDSQRFESFLNEVSSHYDMVFFDTPALLYVPEVAEFLQKVDGLVYTVKIKETSRSSFNRLLSKTKLIDITKLGAIVIGVSETELDTYGKKHEYYKRRRRSMLPEYDTEDLPLAHPLKRKVAFQNVAG
ncbi:hypothetical protein EYV94_08260 [Puteibacter caeruleilacunae]|nr:hypothetical protein EYV94_08260 [Puteibacter caeruleilacunae]